VSACAVLSALMNDCVGPSSCVKYPAPCCSLSGASRVETVRFPHPSPDSRLRKDEADRNRSNDPQMAVRLRPNRGCERNKSDRRSDWSTAFSMGSNRRQDGEHREACWIVEKPDGALRSVLEHRKASWIGEKHREACWNGEKCVGSLRSKLELREAC